MNSLKNVKWTVRLFIVVFSFFTMNLIIAQDTSPEIVLTEMNEKSFRIDLKYLQEVDLGITLSDQEAIKLWSTQLDKVKKYSKIINLVNLPNGVYFLEIEDHQKLTTYRMELANNEELFIDLKEKNLIKPSLQQEDKSLIFTFFSPDPSRTVLLLQDQEERTLYREVIKNKWKIIKPFDLSRLPAGEYAFITKTNGQVFKQKLKL